MYESAKVLVMAWSYELSTELDVRKCKSAGDGLK